MQKNILLLALTTVGILLIPLLAMQFTNKVVWTLSDFVFAGVFIFGTGIAYLLTAQKTGTAAYKIAIGVALAATFLLVWINLAVGIIGSEDNPINSLYFGVILIGIIGTIIARLKPHGMMRAMFITAAAQVCVPIVALGIGRPEINSVEAFMGVVGIFMLSWFFAGLFAGSGLMFCRAGIASS